MVMVYVNIDLDEISDEDLREELEGRGYTVTGEGTRGLPGSVSVDDHLERIEHLLTCGLRAEARAELIDVASQALGRPL